jgi:hypothetical protein
MVGWSSGLSSRFVLPFFFFFFLGISVAGLYVSVNVEKVDHSPWVSSTRGATVSSVSLAFFFFFFFSLTSMLWPLSCIVVGSVSACCAS